MAETVRLAGSTGIIGGSIEDTTGDRADPIYSLEVAAERVRAAVEAARALPFSFALTARADQYMHGRPRPGGGHRPRPGFPGGGGGYDPCSWHG